MPPFCFSYPLPQSAQFCPLCLSPFSVMFPLLELRICQTSYFFLHSLVSIFFYFPSCFPYSLTPHVFLYICQGFHSWCACLSTPSLPLSFPPSLLCPFLFKSRQGSFEGPERRPWRGARRKGCGRPHCSTLLCCADSDTSSL